MTTEPTVVVVQGPADIKEAWAKLTEEERFEVVTMANVMEPGLFETRPDPNDRASGFFSTVALRHALRIHAWANS